MSLGFKHQRCGPYQPRPAALVLRTKKKKPYLIPPTARPQDQKVWGPSGGGMVIVYLLLVYEYLGRCPRLVWVGPLALKPDLIDSHHPGIRYEPNEKKHDDKSPCFCLIGLCLEIPKGKPKINAWRIGSSYGLSYVHTSYVQPSGCHG